LAWYREIKAAPLCNSRNFMLQKRPIFVKPTVVKELRDANVLSKRKVSNLSKSFNSLTRLLDYLIFCTCRKG